MAIQVNLDLMLEQRGMTLPELSERVAITLSSRGEVSIPPWVRTACGSIVEGQRGQTCAAQAPSANNPTQSLRSSFSCKPVPELTVEPGNRRRADS